MIKIIGQEIRRFSVDELRPFARENPEFYAPAGREHYRLLAYLSTKVSGTIFDIGTHRGASALALSYNSENTVVTYDVVDNAPPVIDRKPNIFRFVRDIMDLAGRERIREELLGSPLILLDIDPHEGTREAEFLSWLLENRYEGIVLLDDVWHFKEMREKVWYQIPRARKIDLSSVGHWSGTGLVSFGEVVQFDEEPSSEDLSGWTLVTGYFDLTKEPDANPELSSRPPSWYLEEHSSSTLAAEHDLVVFTEPEFEEAVWQKRPGFLHPRTKVVTHRFSDFRLYKHREEIWKNRGGHQCARDRRNTASYYLFCMARSEMMIGALLVTESPFYAWINICIERMGIRNVMHLDDALACRRPGFSTCRIGYQPPPTDLAVFYGKGGCADPSSSCGGCTFCSGFYTGERSAMLEMCILMEAEFMRALSAGYGHADEQVMALVHAKHPDLFDWYPGDYAQMITNYSAVRENPAAPLRNLLLPAVSAGDWEVASIAARRLWESYVKSKCELSQSELDQLLWAMREIRKHT